MRMPSEVYRPLLCRMEEDNAHDIFKYLVSSTGKGDAATVSYKGEQYHALISLHGNILCANGVEDAQVPLIFIVERATVRKVESNNLAITLSFPNSEDNLTLDFSSSPKDDIEKWMIKLATCAHAMARAELDELAYKFFTMGTSGDSVSIESPDHSFHNFYLTNPARHTHSFAVSQQNGLPSRLFTLEESMWESKLSLILPAEFIKLFKSWNSEFSYLLETKQHVWPESSLPALYGVLRDIRDNGETYEQCAEFLASYNGPSFRKSVEKHRIAFGPVPTNLHVQVFGLQNANCPISEVLTAGTASALPLRFANGGLSRLISSLDIASCFRDNAFWSKRAALFEIKKNIGELSHQLDVEWKPSKFGKPDKVCVQLHAGIKQIYEKLKDITRSILGVEHFIEMLVDEDRRRVELNMKVDQNFRIVENLQNQQDNLDAMLISLHTKIAVMDTLNDEQRESYEQSAKGAMATCLNMLFALVECVMEAQLLGFVISLSNNNAHIFYHIQLRSDFLLSQSATIGATAVLSRINSGWPISTGNANDLLLVVFSFLSAYGDERGMAEDAYEAWKRLEAFVQYKLIRAPSSLCRNCIPIVAGDRSNITISLPIPHDVYDKLPEELRSKGVIRLRTAYFNLGVNHEATLGQSFGGLAFEAMINQEGAEKVLAYSNHITCSAEAREVVMDLVNTVAIEPSRKNLTLFDSAMAACDALHGRAVISCKSGKDRTGMAVTLEQGRVLRQNCGLNIAQVSEVVASLRRDGIRRENCRKNVGKAVYSFSPFQMHFLPKAFRPPSGTYSQGVAS